MKLKGLLIFMAILASCMTAQAANDDNNPTTTPVNIDKGESGLGNLLENKDKNVKENKGRDKGNPQKNNGNIDGGASKAEPPVPVEDNKIYDPDDVEYDAEFRGGTEAMLEWIKKNLQYPEDAVESQISGRIMVKAVINKNGVAEDVEVVNPLHPLLDAEAKRLVHTMPAWDPAYNKGVPVKVVKTIAVTFRAPHREESVYDIYKDGMTYYRNKQYDKAIELFEKGAQLDDPNSHFALATCYFNGNQGVPRDRTKAFDHYKAAAEGGHYEAGFQLGISYYFGFGCKIDYKKAFEIFQQYADDGQDSAIFDLALCYMNGHGTKKDKNMARHLFNKLIDSGSRLTPDCRKKLEMLK